MRHTAHILIHDTVQFDYNERYPVNFLKGNDLVQIRVTCSTVCVLVHHARFCPRCDSIGVWFCG